jgi:hypothetical protein
MKDFDDTVIDEIDRESKPDSKPDAPPATVPAATGERMVNPFAVFRQRNSSGAVLFRGDLIKCDHNTGEWLRMHGENATLIGADERFIVNLPEQVDSWSKRIGGKLIERRVYRTIDFEFAPVREALGDLDEKQWEIKGNQRKDPWSRELYLPMKGRDGEVCAFKATGASAISEIGELGAMYASADRAGKLPVIRPDARSFPTQHKTTVFAPVFRLVDWQYWDGDMPAPPVPLRPISAVPPPAKPMAKLAAPPGTKHGDMDDQVSF